MAATDPQAPSAPGSEPAGPVLVAYATRFGSTRGVAERIASRLIRAGYSVELRACEEIDGIDRYAAVVFGSPVFNQRWLPEADRFLRRSADTLARRPLWLYTIGTFDDTKALIGRWMRREPRNIEATMATLSPREYRVFAGVIDRHQWPLGSRVFYHALGGRLGDNRNWPQIDAWTDSIARSLDRLSWRQTSRS